MMGVGDTDTDLKATRFQSKTKQSDRTQLNSKAFQLLQENKSVFLLNKSCSYGISFLYTCCLYKVTVNIAIYFLEYFQLSFFLAAFVKCWHDRGKVH